MGHKKEMVVVILNEKVYSDLSFGFEKYFFRSFIAVP